MVKFNTSKNNEDLQALGDKTNIKQMKVEVKQPSCYS